MYYTLLKAWRACFGSSEIGLRSLSVLASTASVALLALSGKLMRTGTKGEGIGLLAALLLAVNEGSIVYAQQARPYAMETLSASAAILFALMLLRELAARPQGGELRPYLPAMIGLGLSAGFTLWLHNTAIFIVLGIWAGLILALLLFVPGSRRTQALVLGVPAVIALIVWAPFLPNFVRQTTSFSGMSYWLSFRPSDVLSVWYLAAGGAPPFKLAALLGLLGTIALLRVARNWAVLLLTVLVVPLAIVSALSYFVKPIFINRLFEWMAPAVMILIACGVMLGVRWIWLRGGVVLALISLCLWSTVGYYRSETEDWRGVLNAMASDSRAGDVAIVLPNSLRVAVDYYKGGEQAVFPEVVYLPAPFPALGRKAKYIGNGSPAIEPADMEMIRTALNRHPRVWLIERTTSLYDPANLVRGEIGAARILKKSYGRNGIVIDLYE
jgi:hypothetical protein